MGHQPYPVVCRIKGFRLRLTPAREQRFIILQIKELIQVTRIINLQSSRFLHAVRSSLLTTFGALNHLHSAWWCISADVLRKFTSFLLLIIEARDDCRG
jgi:hypothetical protein